MTTETNDPNQTAARPTRKFREGVVTSVKMEKTAIVAVESRKPHPRYGKTMARSKKYFVHDEANDALEGDRVRITEMRPMSKNKRWRLVEVLERAQ